MHLTSELYEQVLRAIRCGARRANDGRRLARAGVGLAVIILRGRKRERRGGAPPLHIVGRVQHCEQVAHRVHRVGVLFITDSNGTDYARRASQVRNAIPS